MLGDIMVTRARLGTDRMDLHSHAKLSCRWTKLMRRLRNLFS